MSRIHWRWEEKDLGFRFRSGRGKNAAECYQAGAAGEFYVIPSSQRKLEKARLDELASLAEAPASPRIVASPWTDYHLDWDRITTPDGICLNWAGCLDKEEIDRREDEGVQRAMEHVVRLVQLDEPARITVPLLCQLHEELMGNIYPFAGKWRTVPMTKGEGDWKWPLPPGGIQPLMDVFARDVLVRSPFVSEDDEPVFAYASEVMNELLAIHPFREGNGRTAFILGNLILMQNGMLPLSTYERHVDEFRYFAACEAGRIHKDYAPLATLLDEWESLAFDEWSTKHGQ